MVSFPIIPFVSTDAFKVNALCHLWLATAMLRCDFIPLGSPFGMLVECWPFKIFILNPLGNALLECCWNAVGMLKKNKGKSSLCQQMKVINIYTLDILYCLDLYRYIVCCHGVQRFHCSRAVDSSWRCSPDEAVEFPLVSLPGGFIMQENWGSTHNNSTVAIKLIVVEIQLWGNKKLIALGLFNYDYHDFVACLFHPQHWTLNCSAWDRPGRSLGTSEKSNQGTHGDPSH